MGIDGVRSVNNLELTQEKVSWDGSTNFFNPGLYRYDYDPTTNTFSVNDASSEYCYKYYFNDFSGSGKDGVILPSVEPAVFELKNPNKNILGEVL